MKKNKCYSPDCDDESCFDPEHYNYICYDPDCDEVHCINQEHYDKQLLRDFQESTDLSVYDHSEEIDYDEIDRLLAGIKIIRPIGNRRLSRCRRHFVRLLLGDFFRRRRYIE